MKYVIAAALLTTALAPALPAHAAAPKLPTRVGQCVTTTIKAIETRLEGVPDSGDQVEYGNGLVGVSYERVPELHTARVGDRVNVCLTSIPKNCPPGDSRGKTYRATDLRTGRHWELPDAEHMCGGA